MLHLKGVKYTNKVITAEEVAADRAALPFGQVPVLIETKADGTTLELGESLAIEVGSPPLRETYKRVAFLAPSSRTAQHHS